MDSLAGHPYLMSSLLGVPGVLIALAAAGHLRTSVFIAGLVTALYALPLASLDAPYWTPQRLGGFAVGVEDVIVSFSLGAGVWFAATLPFRRRVKIAGRWPDTLARFAGVGLGGLALSLLAQSIIPIYLPALLMVMIAMAFVLGWLRPDLLPLALASLLLYPAYYVAILYLSEALLPGFFDIWDGPELWGPRLFGLPIEEVAFVAMFSLTGPLVVGAVIDARFDLNRQRDRGSKGRQEAPGKADETIARSALDQPTRFSPGESQPTAQISKDLASSHQNVPF